MIPQAFIDELLNRLDITEVVGKYVELKGSGSSRKACCPFHNEKTPSFSVSQDKQLYHCFGCGVGGNAVTFVMEIEGIDFPSAIKSIASIVGIDVPEESMPVKPSYAVDLYAMNASLAEYFRQQLKKNVARSEVVSKLKSLHLTRDLSNLHKVGYSSGVRNHALSNIGLNPKALKYLAKVELACDKPGIIIPVYGFKSTPEGFICDTFDDRTPSGEIYCPSTAIFDPSRELFNLYDQSGRTMKNGPVYVVASHRQVLALEKLGYTNVCCPVNGLVNDVQAGKLVKYSNSITVILPQSKSGHSDAWEVCQSFLPYLSDGNLIDFLFYESKTELLSALSGHTLKERSPLPEYLIDGIIRRHQECSTGSLSDFARPSLDRICEGMMKNLIRLELESKW